MFGDLGVDGHSWFDDHGFGAEFGGLEHGHGGADAFYAGDIAGGGDDAATAAADDDGLVFKLWIVAFFDGGVEGIAVHVGDGKGHEFGVKQDARGGAIGATGPRDRRGQAVTAKGAHE